MAKCLNWKWALPALGILSIGLWAFILACKGVPLETNWDALKEIPAALGWLTPVAFWFSTRGWRWKIFQNWLVLIPDLNGTWKGTLQTTWKNPKTGEVPGPIDAFLVIHQTLFRVSCLQMTKESKSWSRSAAVNMDADNQLKILDFVYSNKPRVSVHERSTDHDGACSLEILDGANRKIKGKYWTDRNTKGEMDFTFHDKNPRPEFEE